MDKENIYLAETPDHSTAYLIVRLSNLHQRKVNAALAKVDLTFSQFVLLSGVYWLILHKTETTQVALAELVKFDKSTVSSVLKTLIAKELITRKEHPVDTRSKLLSITTQGEKLLKKAMKIVDEVDKAMYELKSVDTGVLNEMLSILLRENE